MLDYNILSQKADVTLYKDNEKITFKDLLSESYVKDINLPGEMLVVNEYYVARPDLISFAVYGDDKYADIICKINGISNPFELNEGMILYIPNSVGIHNLFNGDQGNSINDFVNSSKVYKKTKDSLNSVNDITSTIDKNSNSTLKKYNNQSRSPGEQTILDKNYTIDKDLGVVIY